MDASSSRTSVTILRSKAMPPRARTSILVYCSNYCRLFLEARKQSGVEMQVDSFYGGGGDILSINLEESKQPK